MIQDIFPHTFDNQYKNSIISATDKVIILQERNIWIKSNTENLIFPTLSELEKVNSNYPFTEKTIYLFSIDNESFFLLPKLPAIPEDYHKEDISIFRSSIPQEMAFAGITAFSLYNWYTAHQFCGKCGHRFRHHPKERALLCDECGQIEYPKISPAVIVGITNRNKILLSKYANREYTRYALIAGFAEIGEPIEDTVKREVMEEVGLKVKNLHYYKSQPWGLTDCLLLGFFAELEGEDSITLDQEELASAEWFSREDIPPTESNISLTSEMIDYFRNNQID